MEIVCYVRIVILGLRSLNIHKSGKDVKIMEKE